MTGARGSSKRQRQAEERRRRTRWKRWPALRVSRGHIPRTSSHLPGGISADEGGFAERAPFVPYLLFAPNDFALVLRFSGGGIYAPGRLMFDADGNLWSGVNWMPGSQSNAATNIGGGVAKLGPAGAALSPPITGFMGAGINGIGWGTAVTRENVWASSFNGKGLGWTCRAILLRLSRTFHFARSCTASWASAWQRTAMYGLSTARATNCSSSQGTRERRENRQSRRPCGTIRCRRR